ncbi:MAG TPA: acyl-CoA dehydrogenase family protein [Solirubrobacterales bacterium]|nr:acyl-CoA dehydrogenase family protein [Solirubrobacterales bacterium]
MKRALFEDEHEWFRESVAAFVDRELMPKRERFREQRFIDRATWLKAGQDGFLGLGVPSEYGGSGIDDFRFNAIFGEELARAGFAYSSSFGIQTDVVAPYLLRLTTDEQKRRWLPGFVKGEIITAIGMTEPAAGSDLKGIQSTARREGEDWSLSGSKTFITNGYNADLIVVAAQTPDPGGISLFAVEKGMDGFSCGNKLNKLGQHEADTAELFFDEVKIPAENLIGEPGRGMSIMMGHLAQERISTAVVNVAHAAVALALTLEYVGERRAFGRPIGSFQNSRFLLAQCDAELDMVRVYVDRCVEAHAAGELTAVEAAKAKLLSSEIQNRVIDACVQMHGGYGYIEEYEIARSYVDARITRIWAGTNEIMREVIGRDLGLEEPRSP